MPEQITLAELQRRLLKVSDAQAVGLTAVHDPDFLKRKNPFLGRVVKRSRVNGFINFRYQTTVNKQRKREEKPADFVAAPRVWGNRVRGCPLVVHCGDGLELYIEIKLERVERLYFDAITFEPISEALIAPFLRKKRRPRRQALAKAVELRDYRLDHVAEIRLNGESWRVAPVSWLAGHLGKGTK